MSDGAQKSNSLAVISLVAGILSYVMAPFLGAVVAIICGHKARAEIRTTGEPGDGLAVAGLVLGYAHFALVFCVGIPVFFFFGAAILSALAAGH